MPTLFERFCAAYIRAQLAGKGRVASQYHSRRKGGRAWPSVWIWRYLPAMTARSGHWSIANVKWVAYPPRPMCNKWSPMSRSWECAGHLYCIPKVGKASGLRSVPSQSRRWVLIWRQRISSAPGTRTPGQLQNAREMPLLVDEKQTQSGKIGNCQQATEQDQQKGNGSAIELDDRSLKADAGNKEIESYRWG